MHELGIATELAKAVQDVAQSHPGRQVMAVRMQVGALRGLVPDVMCFCWQAATKQTVLEGSVLHLKWVPAAGRCRTCGREFNAEDLIFICPACEGVDVETVRGKELILDRVEMN